MTDHDEIPVVRIPADVDQPDKVVAGLTARQTAVLGGVALALWLLYQGCQELIPPLVFLPVAALTLMAAAVLLTASRDRVPLDRLLFAWFQFRRTPREQITAPEGVAPAPGFLTAVAVQRPRRFGLFRSPLLGVTSDGVLDLGSDGVSTLAECSTVNLALRSPREQVVLLSGYSRWLNSLTGPVAVSIRTAPADLTATVTELRNQATELTHPTLRNAASKHADFLADLAAHGRLLTRSIHLAVHEPTATAASRVRRRLEESAALLASTDVTARPLDEPEVAAVVIEALNPREA